jgi:preprotein translocase subunit SecA
VVNVSISQTFAWEPVPPPRVLAGLDARVDAIVGWCRRHAGPARRLRAEAELVDRLAPRFSHCSDSALRAQLLEFRDAFRRPNRVEPALLHQALAAIREAAARTIGLQPFPEQLMGALALHRGFLAEMATGEGKTLTAGLAAVLAGWTRRPCHVITVNDYLAERDAAWMRPLFEFCGVTVGCVLSTMAATDRRQAYARDVTYTTSKEVVADFLRDRLLWGRLHTPARRWLHALLLPSQVPTGCVQRGLHTAIVDEADSVLIDEAVTPLIISGTGPPAEDEAVYRRAWQLAAALLPGHDYLVRPRHREVELLPPALARLEEALDNLPPLWRSPARRRQLLQQALVAREFFHRDRQYVVQDGKIVIVDEFTGRLMPLRRWRDGLHQLIEAKEGLPVTPPDHTLARLSFQRFYRLYRHLSGMTGTAREAAAELWHIYRLAVVVIPTHRPCIRQHWPDRVFPDAASKWAAVVEEIERLHRTGRPVLVGTRSVAASEDLARRLSERGLPFSLLHATRHREEARIVAEAGHRGKITIATNMAGRGTDIKLGPGVAALGGLHVIATERHESPRIDRQLYGRAARQGDPGSAQTFLSLEDELFVRFLPEPLRHALARYIRVHGPGAQTVAAAACVLAQSRAARLARRQRQAVLRYDTWLDESLAFTPPHRT